MQRRLLGLTILFCTVSIFLIGIGFSALNVNLYISGEAVISSLDDIYKDEDLMGSDPILTPYLIPVTISATGTVSKADLSSKWYDYNNKSWANAVMIKTKEAASYYEEADAGEILDTSLISAYYVWIPRYEYQIFDDYDNAGKWGEDNGEEQEIYINFVSNTEEVKTSTSKGEWFTHPAFSIVRNTSVEQISGFWVQKFELTGTQSYPTSLPNESPLKNLNLANYFYSVESMPLLYNLSTSDVDSHLIKNSEWSAVAYLANSLNGKNSEIYPNTNSEFVTGCSSNNVIDSGASVCFEGFGTLVSNIYNSSTTGNITGVFDMSGGLFERTMGIMATATGGFFFSQSGFMNLEPEYFDSYPYGSGGNQYYRSGYGQAISETAAWYSDYSVFVSNSASPWIIRSGDASSKTSAGIFAFMASSGASYYTHGARGTLWIK